jgi:membrane-bound serine protease (ClpP class)
MARRLVVGLFTVLAALQLALPWAVTVAARQQEPTGDAPVVVVAEYDGIIHPIAAEFFEDVLTRADTSGARAVVLVLRTPGGLLESTRTIISRMIAARTPVVVYVGPSGARAASAGFLLTLAADVAAMAPGTHIGAAHPVQAGGGGQETPDSTTSQKAAEDTAAYARTLAGARKRNVTLAAEAVLQSRAFTEEEARTATPPLIDLVAPDLNALMTMLDGRRVTRFDGRETVLNTAQAGLERMEMTRRQQLLSAIAHPQIAYLLLSLGMLGLVVEMWNPGAIAPAVVGGICLLLAFFAFQIIPVNATGILLIALGILLVILEVKVPSFGVLGVGGIVSLLAGAVMVTGEVPGVTVSYGVIVPVVLASSALLLLLGRLALRAQQMKAVTGAEGLIDEVGHALTSIGPEGRGQVSVHGEIWRARSASSIPAGTPVKVAAVEGLTLTVTSVSPAAVGSIEGDTR